MESKNARSYLFDNIKVLLIFGVVYAHFIRVTGEFDPEGLDGYLYIVFFSFIMQGFLFVSGFFSKNVEKCRKGAGFNFLFPYLIWMIGMYLVRFLISDDATFRLYHPSHAMWFFIVMFVYRFFLKDVVRLSHILLISVVLYFITGCFPFLNENLSLGRIFSFLFFFLLGYYCKWDHIKKIQRFNHKYGIICLGILMIVLYIITKCQLIPVEMWHLKDGYADYGIGNLEGIMIRFVIAIISLLWLFTLINLIPDRKLSISEIGQHTLPIFVFHVPLRYLIQEYGVPMENDFVICIVCVVFSAITVYLLSRPVVHKIYDDFLNLFYPGILKIKY